MANRVVYTAPNIRRVLYTTPYDSEIEYLGNRGGSSYIDSGIYANKNTKIEMRFCANSFNVVSGGIIGVHTTESGHKNFGVLLGRVNAEGKYIGKIQYSNFTGKGLNTDIYLNELGVYHTLVYRNGLLRLDNEEVYINFPNQETLDTMFIMRANGSSFSSLISVSYCKIWNGDILVRDFIPVRKGTIGYMYDKVSGKLFGNKGTGNFTLGPDVANPMPNIRRVFRFGNKRFVMPMPYDKRVEYLESTGTQYIDTLIKPNSKTEFDLKIYVLSKRLLFGGLTNADNNTFAFIITGGNESQSTNTTLYFRNTGKNNRTINNYNVYNIHTYSFKGGKFIIDNVVKDNLPVQEQTNTAIYSIYLFNRENNGRADTNYKCIARLYSFKCYQNNTLIQDLIPVRVGSIGYMYDRVSGKLFGNSGTGQFILGNDIND